MKGDTDSRLESRYRELLKELVSAPRGTTETRLLGEHVVGLGSSLLLEEMRRTARGTRLLAIATVVLGIATSASAIWAAIR